MTKQRLPLLYLIGWLLCMIATGLFIAGQPPEIEQLIVLVWLMSLGLIALGYMEIE